MCRPLRHKDTPWGPDRPPPPVKRQIKDVSAGGKKKKTTSTAVGNLFLIRIDTPVGSDKSD